MDGQRLLIDALRCCGSDEKCRRTAFGEHALQRFADAQIVALTEPCYGFFDSLLHMLSGAFFVAAA